MTDTLKFRLQEAVKDAMRARDKARLGTLRLAMAEIKKVEVDERIDPDDDRIQSILDRMIKQRRDAHRQFSDAGRQDLAEAEAAEIIVLPEFMPQPLTDEEIDRLIEQCLAQTHATGPRDMGKVMQMLRPLVLGRVDMADVSRRLKNRLNT